MSGDRNERRHDADVGSLAEEAVKLLGALSDWAKDTTQDLTGDLESHLATGAPECTVCPICRTVHAVRGLSPEVKNQLASAASSLLQAAASVLATAAPEKRSSGGFENIDLDDPDDPEAGAWPVDPEEDR